MQSSADAQEDRTVELIPPVRPCAPWRVVEVEALPGFRLQVRFNDGSAGIVDMATLVNSETAGVFAALRDEGIFRQAKVRSVLSVGLASSIWPRMPCISL